MKVISIFAVVLLSMISSVQAEEIILGEQVDMDLYQPLNKVLASPKQFANKEVTLKGKITKVCKKKGCWADITSDDALIRIKVIDDVIVIPIYAVGREAYATGKLSAKVLTKAETVSYLQHMAEDAGEPFDPSSVETGMTLYQLKAQAVRII